MARCRRAPVLCFDGDAAGARAAARAVELALPMLAPDRTLKFATLPAGEDPDSLVGARAARRRSRRCWTRRGRCPTRCTTWCAERSATATPEQRAAFRTTADRGMPRRIPDKCAGRRIPRACCWTASSPSAARAAAAGHAGVGRGGTQRDGRSGYRRRRACVRARCRTARTAPTSERARILTAILLRHPDLLHDVDHAYAALPLDPPLARAARGHLEAGRKRADALDSAGLIDHLTMSGLQRGCRARPGGGARAAAGMCVARGDASGG